MCTRRFGSGSVKRNGEITDAGLIHDVGQCSEQGPLFSKCLRSVHLGRRESQRNLDDFSAPAA